MPTTLTYFLLNTTDAILNYSLIKSTRTTPDYDRRYILHSMNGENKVLAQKNPQISIIQCLLEFYFTQPKFR